MTTEGRYSQRWLLGGALVVETQSCKPLTDDLEARTAMAQLILLAYRPFRKQSLRLISEADTGGE